jgi:hypothetical protein
LLSQLNDLARGWTSGVLHCDNSGSGEAYGGLAFDYADFNDYHFYCELHLFEPLVQHFSRDWRPPRPWIFGEFNDADDYRDLDEIAAAYNGSLPWWLAERNPLHPLDFIAYPEQPTRMAALHDLGFDYQALQRISRQQSFVVRKTILEKVRARAGVGGYVVTGLRDTPVASSAVFDDLGRAKYPADAFREFNADSVLLLEQGRKRTWKHGGDRPAPVDRFNHVANTPVDFRLLLAHAGSDLPGGEYRWQVLTADEQIVLEGGGVVAGPLPGGRPVQIGFIAFNTPDVQAARQYSLRVDLNSAIHNRWPLWVYPAVTDWPTGLLLADPGGGLRDFDDLLAATQAWDGQSSEGDILIASALTDGVIEFVQRGGRALLQTGPGRLRTTACPFWRESVHLLYDHPVMAGFAHPGYAETQFYHLASDLAFETDYHSTGLPDLKQIIPIMRRLDARQFRLHDYLVELHIGSGVLLASTLRFDGGAGDQVRGLKGHPAGRYLLDRMLAYLIN